MDSVLSPSQMSFSASPRTARGPRHIVIEELVDFRICAFNVIIFFFFSFTCQIRLL